jgi:type I restriction enzyme S subunit
VAPSVVPFSTVGKAGGRLDAEYFQREYLEVESYLEQLPGATIRQAGGILDCSAFYPSITGDYKFDGTGIPFLRVNDIQDGFVVVTSRTAFLSEAVLSENAGTIKTGVPGDIVIAKGGNTLAKVGIVGAGYERVALSRDLILLRTAGMTRDPHLTWLFLHSDFGQKLLWRTASRTGQPHLTLGPVGEIFVPELDVHFDHPVGQIHQLASELKAKSERLYRDAEALLLSFMGQVDRTNAVNRISVRKLSETFGRTGRLDSEYWQAKYEQNQAHLQSKPHQALEDLVYVRKSIEPGSDAYSTTDSGLPFVRVSDFDKYGLYKPSIALDPAYVAQHADALNELMPKPGTILLSKDGTVGQAFCIQLQSAFVVSGGILLLDVKDPASCMPNYLTLVLNSELVQMQARRDAGGSVILHWKPSEIKALLVPTVDLEIQASISKLVEASLVERAKAERLVDDAAQRVLVAIENDRGARGVARSSGNEDRLDP